MAQRFKNIDRDTPLLLPPDLRDWVAEDDLVHFVIAAVERLPLSRFKVNEKGCGDEQYPPHLLLALLVYCYANGIFSSRRIERATYRDVAVRLEEMRRVILAELDAARETLPCGHPAALLVKSVESDYQFFELCETKDRLRDALTMERMHESALSSAKEEIERLRAVERGSGMCRDGRVPAGSVLHRSAGPGLRHRGRCLRQRLPERVAAEFVLR